MPGSDNRWQIRSALAFYDLQVAHDHLESLDPADRQYDQALDDLKTALEEYRRIISRIEAERRRTTKLKDESARD